MLLVKKIGQWELSLEAKRSTRALPKISQILWTASGWSVYSSEETLFLDNMSAPWFILPGTCVAFSGLPHKKVVRQHAESLRDEAALVIYVWHHGSAVCMWCPWMFSRKNWQAWHTASISRQLMCRPDSSSDHRPKVGLPSHSAPQPLLEASVVTTFLLCTVSRITPYFSQKRSLQRARADTQAESPLRGGVRDARPRMEPSASSRTGWVACEADPTEVPAKPLP